MVTDVQGVLFDFGGTLFGHDSLADTIAGCVTGLGAPAIDAIALAAAIDAAAMTDAERALGRDLDAEVWSRRWRHLYGAGDVHVAGLGAAVDAAMHDPHAWHPHAGALTLLRDLARLGIPVAVVSNTGWDVRRVFDAHGVRECVSSFLLSYEVGLVKPSTALFHQACDSIGIAPPRAVMVGDDAAADGGAAAAGITTVIVRRAAVGGDNGLGVVRSIVGLGPSAPNAGDQG